MASREQRIHSSAPAVVPRWEWRTFGGFEEANEALASLRTVATVESDETYILSRDREVSAKNLARQIGVKSVAPCAPAVADRHSAYQVALDT